jgi:aspartyl/glutamyl-tRNA(Asn/Gln) amidotransferase C subunit
MDIKGLENLADLARIKFFEDEKRAMLKDMEGILDYVNQINEAEAPTIVGVPTGVGIEDYNHWREDRIEERDFSKELIKEQFPDAQDDFLKVKKIL